MVDIDCNNDLRAYHNEKVTLGKSDQNEMSNRRNSGRTRLKNGLTRMEKPQPQKIESQGSYSMKTMVQDDDCEYDIDDGVYFKPESLTGLFGISLSPAEARARVCDALSDDDRLKSPAVVKRNCVRQTYPQGYHIDYPIYRIKTEKDSNNAKKEFFELSSGNDWVRSDARAVTNWFNGLVTNLNSGEVDDGSQLRRVVRYTKKFARSRTDWKSKTTSGITITKLVVDHFQSNDGRDDLAIRNTWKEIKKALNVSTEVKHPVLKDVKLAEINDTEVNFFKDKLAWALNELTVLDEDDCKQKSALNTWDTVFDTSFFSARAPKENNSQKSAFVVTSSKTAERNDDGGRFG